MFSQIPKELVSLERLLGKKIHFYTTIKGGSINEAAKLLFADGGTFFLKWNQDPASAEMFHAEVNSLTQLGATNTLSVPRFARTFTDGITAFLLMEFVDQGMRHDLFWESTGRSLAALHNHTALHYGLPVDNFIGTLTQYNKLTENWVSFFVNQRLEKQVQLALKKELLTINEAHQFQLLYLKLEGLLVVDKPALLHGDLWHGNIFANENGDPTVFDPAMYYGNREIELAFTTLFGGFSDAFYEAYMEVFPLEEDYEKRFAIYNLYPLLVHLNLFGKGYLSQIKGILNYFI